MKLARLLEEIKKQSDIGIEERKHPDGTRVFIFFSDSPVPLRHEPRWYPLVVSPGQDTVDNKEIEAMLRHLWQFQLDIPPQGEAEEK